MPPDATTVVDGAGRSRVVVKDTRGPTTLRTRVLDCKQVSAFSQQGDGLAMGLVDPNSKTGPFARGQLTISANVSPQAGATYDSLQLEVNVLGLLGAGSDIIARLTFSQLRPLATVDIDKPYDSIQFEARQVVDGAGNGTQVPLALNFAAAGRFWE